MPWSTKKPVAAEIAPDWLQPYCKKFLQTLADHGYARVSMRTYDRAIALFCGGVARRRLDCDQFVGATLAKVRAAALAGMHPNKHDQKRYCLDRFIDALVEAGIAQRPTPPRKTPTALERLRTDYEPYLRDQRGLTKATTYHCVSFLNRFMAFRFGDTLGDLNDITPHEIVDFLRKLRSDGNAPRDKTPPSHLRNLFQRIDMHRPERLRATIAHVCAHARAPPLASLQSFLPLLTAQFGLIFRKLACNASKMREPARECLFGKPMLTAIFGLRNAAALPRLDVNRPPLASDFLLEMSWTHRRFSTAAENAKWNENTSSKSHARFGRLHPTD
jgi:hypothetical protein